MTEETLDTGFSREGLFKNRIQTQSSIGNYYVHQIDVLQKIFKKHKDLNQLKTVYAFDLDFLCRNHADRSDYCTDVGIHLTKETCLQSALLLSQCPNQCNNCDIIRKKCPALGDHLCSVAKEWVEYK